MTILPRSILGRTLMMTFGVSLIGAVTSLLLLFSVPPPSAPPLSLYELGRLARGLPIASEDGGPPAHLVVEPSPAPFPVDQPRSQLLQRLLVERTGLPAATLSLEVAVSLRYPGQARRLERQIRLYGLEGVNPYIFDSLRLLVRQHDGRWRLIERIRPQPLAAWRRLSAGWILTGLLLVLPIALLFANRLTRPIRAFARASSALGADAGGASIPPDGPSEIVEAATAFNRMQERIRRQVAERTTTLAAVAHDLRTPLARLRFRIEGTSEPLRAKIIADLDAMDAMIGATLRLIRDEAEPAPQAVIDLAPLLGQTVASYREQDGAVTLACDGDLRLTGDGQALRRMVENLVNNAVAFAGAAEITAVRTGDTICLSVADRGPGLLPEALVRAFDPFWRAEASRNRDTGGTGLGLSIVAAIARRHGGRASLAARDGGGLIATVELPAAA